MGIFSFLKNNKPEKKREGGIRTFDLEQFEKVNNEHYDASSDPVIATRFAPSDLKQFLELYATHPWVYACANAIANAAASIQWQIISKGKEVDAEERPAFLAAPNPNLTWYELIETTFLHLELTGNSYWEIQKGAKGDGTVDAIYPLRPDLIEIKPDAKKKIDHYEFDAGGGRKIIYKPDEILHIKYTNPRDEYYGIAPIFSVQNEITMDFWATLWNRKFFQDGAEPGSVLETDRVLSEQSFNRLLSLWQRRHRGRDNAHKVAILEDGLKYRQITSSHQDMQYTALKTLTRDTVLAVMRVPPVIVGLTEGVSYATSKDQKKIFWQDNIIPKLRRIEDMIDTFLIPEEMQFKFVTRSIDSIIEDDQIKAQIAQSNVAHGIMTQNEVRDKYYDMDAKPWGEDWWAPVGLAPVSGATPAGTPTGNPNQTGAGVTTGSDAGLASPAQVPSVGQPPRPPALPTRGVESAAPSLGKSEAVELEKIESREPDWNNPTDVRDWREWTLWKTAAGPDDRRLRSKLKDFFSAQFERLKPQIERQYKPRKVEKGELAFAKASNEVVLDIREEDKKLSAVVVSEAERLLKKYGDLLLSTIRLKPADKDKVFNLDDPDVRAYLQKFGAQNVRQINAFTQDMLNRKLAKFAQDGAHIKEVLAELNDVFNGELSLMRAQRIARTELVTLTNQARIEAARQSGVVKKKRWVSMLLPTTRDEKGGASHVALHGQEIDIDETFQAKNRSGGVDEMDGPGDLDASGENVCNCLCLVNFFSGTDEFADILSGPVTE